MDIFADVLRSNHTLLRAAAIRAAFELGVFQTLCEANEKQPYDLAGIAARLGLPQHRLRPLLDVLVAEGYLSRIARIGGDGIRIEAVPERTEDSAGEWDRIAEVISSDQPLDVSETWLEGHLKYVADKGRIAAPFLWKSLDPKPGARLLDVGGGLGAYSLAYVSHHPDNWATLVDLPETLSLLERTAADLPARLEMKRGDARVQLPSSDYDIVLLANLLHLYGPRDCAEVVRRASGAAAVGGLVVVKDVLVDPDRTGPLVGLYFALNMALFTDAGDVHPGPAIVNWMREAGLTNVKPMSVAGLDGSTVIVGKRQEP